MTHIDLYKRLEKGSPLTPGEGDSNWDDIETAVNAIMDRSDGVTDDDGSLLDDSVNSDALQVETLARGYYLDTGVTANLIEIAVLPQPVNFAALLGVTLHIKVANLITGACSIKLTTGAGVSTVALRHYGAVEMAANEIQAGQIIEVTSDGTIWQFNSAVAPAAASPSTRTGFTNLRTKNNEVSPNAQIDVTADEIVCVNALGVYASARAVTKTLDMGIQGPGGREATLNEAASTWFYGFFLISADLLSTTVVFSSTSAAPTLANVTGYTGGYWCPIGAFYNDSGSNLQKFSGHDRQVSLQPVLVINARPGNAVTTNTYFILENAIVSFTNELIAFRTAVPPIANYVRGVAGLDTTATARGEISVARAASSGGADDNQVGEQVCAGEYVGASPNWGGTGTFDVPVNGQNIAVRCWHNAGAKYKLTVNGFRW